MEEIQKEGIQCITRESPAYPGRMKQLAGMPRRLYVKGSLPRDDRPSAAIIGARECTYYGKTQAFRFARALSEAGVQIISGMAYGIDSEAHWGAFKGIMPTYAVLGCGADICYPKRNEKLYEQIAMSGGILSEQPCGRRPIPGFFPARNRIISALADVVIVVEAKERSGSFITVDFALEQGKSVYAVPGPADSPFSRGCHRLIEQGAGIAYAPEAVLSQWPEKLLMRIQEKKKKQLGLAKDLDLVYSCLDLQPRNLEFLAGQLPFTPEKLVKCLTKLELSGYIFQISKNYYVRKEKS